jgi:CBS domain-containing protein
MSKVSQILEAKAGKPLISVNAETPVLEVIRLMAEHHIGSVLVMNGSQLEGIATERDYARKVILKGRNSQDTPVRIIMSSPVLSVSSDHSVNECMALMTEKHFRHLPVVDEGKVVGMISIGDLVKALIEEQRAEIDQLQRYIAS